MQRVILAGAGHANAQVLRNWCDERLPNVELVVISPHALAPYSGMVPGWLDGIYKFEDITIDFSALCQRAGVQWVASAIERLDPDRQYVYLNSGESLHYDWLCLNIGSTLTPPKDYSSEKILSMRPLSQLRFDYEDLLDRWNNTSGDRPFQVTTVGGGAAGFETLLAVLHRLRTLQPKRLVRGTLLTTNSELLPGYPRAVKLQALRALRNANVTVQLNTPWSDKIGQDSDLVLWAAGAQSHAWQTTPRCKGSLATSTKGFVLIDTHLRSVSHPTIFAVGDCAQWHVPLPKAGVYAVRMGPILTHNLHAVLTNQPLKTYSPQKNFLSLLSVANNSAIASRGIFCLAGHWVWRLKDYIDRSFLQRFKVS